MKFAFLLLTCVVLRAAPTAIAFSPSIVNLATAPCWAGDYPDIGASFNTTNATLNTLVGTSSINAVDYLWTKQSGPGTATFGSASASATLVTVSAPGKYVFRLLVHDSMAASSTFDLTVGAVAFDRNGVIIPTTINVTKFFDKMIAFGRNVFCKEDWMQLRMSKLQIANNTYYTNEAAIWSTYGQGTISYPLSGVGYGLPGADICGTTSCNGTTVGSSDTSFSIHNSQRLTGLASLPTWIVAGGSGLTGEMIRVCSVTAIGGGTWGGTGDATVNVCFDGRGLAAYYIVGGGNQPSAPASHPNGEVVGEMRIQGSGTLFATDSQRPLAPAGVPGPPGPMTYNAGSVSVSGTIWTLTGGTWTSPAVQPGYMIRVTATHNGGTPFVWWDSIASVDSTSQIHVSRRDWPVGADSSSVLSYQITGIRYVSLEFGDTVYGDKGDGLCLGGDITKCGTHFIHQTLQGCESETACFATSEFDLGVLNDDLEVGMHFSYKNSQGAGAQPYGAEFYSTSMALLTFYLRSGWTDAQVAAQLIGDYWLRDPEFRGGWNAPYGPFQLGFGVIGGIASMAINPSSQIHIWDLRKWAAVGAAFNRSASSTCNAGADTRDTALNLSYVTLAAMFDTDSNYLPTWKAGLDGSGGALTRSNNCKQADNSYANGAAFATSGNGIFQLLLQHGSTIATGTGFTTNNGTSVCSGVAEGVIDVTNGSFSATLFSGSLGTLATNTNILIYDTTTSPRYVGAFTFSFSGSAVILAGKWPGATGRFNFMVEDNTHNGGGGGATVIGANGTDSDNLLLQETWGCIRDSATQIHLNKAWDDYVTDGVDTAGTPHHLTGTSTGTYYMYSSQIGVAGYYQQPFMLGVLAKIFSWIANYVPDATIQAGFSALLPGIGTWYHDTGYDPYLAASYYARVHNTCPSATLTLTGPMTAPKNTTDAPGSSIFESIASPCGFSGYQGYVGSGEYSERVNNSESFPAVIAYYRAQCTVSAAACDAARTFGDKVYGAMWGDCSTTLTGLYCDSHILSNADGELADAGASGGLGTYKWPGFFFGMGMQHQWPAIRCENAAPGTLGCVDTGASQRYPSSMRRPASSR